MALDDDHIISEEDLLRRAKQGDQKAFGELVRTYQDQVYNLACRTLGDADRAQDAAQEAFIRAWQALPKFEGRSKFSSWLYRITVNVSLSELRRTGKPVEPYPSEILDLLSGGTPFSGNFDTVIEERDFIARLIADLAPLYRTIVVLFYQYDLDIREIASVTERPVGTIKAYLHRARAQMRLKAVDLLKTRKRSL